MTETETIKLTRDVAAILVPHGMPVTIPKDTAVTVTQSLGGSFTVTTEGAMYRIESKDADALGKTNPDLEIIEDKNLSLEDKIWGLLRTCYDPEIPVNIVDLGLVYEIKISPTDDGKFDVIIRMTLTAPGCGMGPIIASEAKQKVLYIPEVKSAEIEIVFDPPWDRSMMSDQAKLELGLL